MRLVLLADPPRGVSLYADKVVLDAFRSLWHEPRPANPPARAWHDWSLVAVLVVLAMAEALFRPDVQWRPLALVLGATPLLTLLWRRSHPLLMVVLAFTSHVVVHYAPFFPHHQSESLYSAAFVLLLPYSLLRWGSGREAVIGLAFVQGTHAAIIPGSAADLTESLAGVAVLLLPAALGASVRFRTTSRIREIDQVKLREREQIARELHDTVAHHVSAIAIQAQAGRAVASTSPAAALEALKVIELEASRTLAEMRTMVGILRQTDEPTLAPQPGVADIMLLAQRAGGSPVIDVAPSGDLGDLTPSVDAAMYRLAQESITNAVRHARRATRISVAVAGDRECVRLTVTDDGEPSTTSSFPASSTSTGSGSSMGYGIVGMTERAALLGGTLHAGPNRGRGWTVTAVLPRNGSSR